MAQVVRYYMYYHDRIAYEPETVAVYTIEHASRRYADIIVGTGDPSAPTIQKYYEQFSYDGGNHPFPANAMVLDITEFGTPTENLFLKLVNRHSTDGTIVSFSIECYPGGYDPRVHKRACFSLQIPLLACRRVHGNGRLRSWLCHHGIYNGNGINCRRWDVDSHPYCHGGRHDWYPSSRWRSRRFFYDRGHAFH
jgi:hypothetical protein